MNKFVISHAQRSPDVWKVFDPDNKLHRFAKIKDLDDYTLSEAIKFMESLGRLSRTSQKRLHKLKTEKLLRKRDPSRRKVFTEYA